AEVGAEAFAADVEPGLAVVAAAGLERLGVVAGVGGGLAGCVPVGGDAAAVGGVQGVVVGGGFGGGLGVGGVAGREGEGQVVVAGVADAEGAAVGFAGGDAAGGHGYEVVLDVVEGGAFGAGDEVFAPQVGLGGQGLADAVDVVLAEVGPLLLPGQGRRRGVGLGGVGGDEQQGGQRRRPDRPRGAAWC